MKHTSQKLSCKMHDASCKLPSRGSSGAAGLDFRARLSDGSVDVTLLDGIASGVLEVELDEATNERFVMLPPGRSIALIPTGVSVAVPDGHVMLLCMRSGLARHGLSLANGVGVIDSDYRGEVKVLIKNDSGVPYKLLDQSRIAQGVVVPSGVTAVLPVIPVAVDSLSSTARGDGGFGSTGVL